MNEWPTVAIGDLGDVFDGPHATPKTVDEGPVFLGIGALQDGRINLGETRHVSPEDFKKWTRRVRPKADDIVFSYETRLGQAALIPTGLECCLGRRMGLVRVNKQKIDPRFFLYTYISPYFQEFLRSRTVHGATVDRILLTEFPSFLFPCPLLHEQQKIASLLGALDDKIELNRRMNETLEAMARAIFKDWFVDFGPVRAKAEGRPSYLAPEIWSLFPNVFDDDDKPAGWEFKPVGQLVDFNPAERLTKGSETPYLDMAALPTQGSWPELPIQRPFASGSKFRDGDTLLARITPCLENGKTAFVQCLGEGIVGWGSTEFIVLRPKPPFPAEYGYLLARDDFFRERAIQSMTGTSGRQRVQTDSLADFEAALPTEQVLRSFGELVRPWFEVIRANAEESQTLAALRDLLLPKLMSGEIRLRDAEKAVESAA